MAKTFLLGLVFILLTISAVAQELRTDIEYKWDKVIKIELYYSPDNEGYCSMENMRNIIGDSTFAKPCNWTDLLDLIKDWNKDGYDVGLEKECIAINVYFGKKEVAFAVFVEQGVLYDLTENTFQYLNIPDKNKFKKIIKECLN